MKILCVSDQIDPLVYSSLAKERFADIDVVLCAGDLPSDYIDFIVSTLNKPAFFIFGNHNLTEFSYYHKAPKRQKGSHPTWEKEYSIMDFMETPAVRTRKASAPPKQNGSGMLSINRKISKSIASPTATNEFIRSLLSFRGEVQEHDLSAPVR